MERLNRDSRTVLDRTLKDVTTSVFGVDGLSILLCANFLREISDTLARIDDKLGGLEMNTRPGS